MSLSRWTPRWTLGAALAAGLAFAPLAFAPHAQAAEVTLNVRNAGDLATLCGAKMPDLQYAAKENFCHGFAQGVVSSEAERIRAAGAGATRHFCIGAGAPSRAATLQEFVKWLDAKPGEKNGAPVATLVKFLSERFPCPTTASAPAAPAAAATPAAAPAATPATTPAAPK